MEAASERFCGIDLNAGKIDLRTNGNPTSAWAMGIKKIEVLKFNGGLSRVIIMPKPNVTADVDKGSIKIGSKKEDKAEVIFHKYVCAKTCYIVVLNFVLLYRSNNFSKH